MRLKLFLRYPVDIRRARRLLDGRDDPRGSFQQPPLVLDLRTPQLMFDCGRHFQSLAYYASRNGSPTIVRCSRLLLGGIARKVFGREMLSQSYVGHIAPDQPIPQDALVLGDYDPDRDDRQHLTGRNATYLRMMIGRDVDRSVPVMPYPMHPAILRTLADTDLEALRNRTSEREAILFAGCQKPRYGSPWMQQQFGILSRLEMLGVLREHFPERVEESMAPSRVSRAIKILDSRVHGIPSAEWLPTLASARFFLCCPGGRQPLCHNLIEAMSVGTIPILEYGDRITPKLRDGETAICFRGRKGLAEAIERIDAMSPDEVAEMSRRVGEFYDGHLCGKRFLSDLREGRRDAAVGQLCMPFHERNFYAAPGSRNALPGIPTTSEIYPAEWIRLNRLGTPRLAAAGGTHESFAGMAMEPAHDW
jgi:hypothetical protein